MREKRAHIRKLMLVDASVADAAGMNWRPVLLLDISPLGASFASAQSMDGGTTAMLRFCMPGSAHRHETVVSIVHSSSTSVPSGFRVGARFVAIDAATTERILDFVGSDQQT